MTTKSDIYCLKCKSYTPNENFRTETIMTKGTERKIQKSNCSVCGKKKNRFIKNTYQNSAENHNDFMTK